jgi:glycerol-3-phosphate responsive antiterminator
MSIYSEIADSPIIAAVKSDQGLEQALNTDCSIIFILYGSVCSIINIVDRIKEKNKIAFVHVDLIEGLSSRDVAVEFIKTFTKADGVISTKPSVIKAAKELGLITVQRFFLIDSLSLENVLKNINDKHTDIIEVLPGVIPKVIKKIADASRVPVIA